ncbi:Apolipoprotein N-acyltransferase [Burkholderiales bacterium 8X]|nr:Apolipoprotein N-acyltransferase [Burkholderiales bacterium 8X]
MKAPARFAALVLAGLAQAASIALPWSGRPAWWLQIVSLSVLALLLALPSHGASHNQPTWRTGFLRGWVFAIAWLCGTFWWLFISLHTYGGLAAPLAVIAVLALAAGLGLYYAAACAIACWLAPSSRAWPIVFAALWTLAELLRNTWFTGFPWGAGGYAHVDGPLAAWAPLFGVYGIGAVAAAIAVVVANAARGPGRRHLGRSLVLVLLLVGLPNALRLLQGEWTTSTDRLRVALLQGNIPQDEKFIPGGGIATALAWYGEELQRNQAPLVITPETALPLLPSQLPPGYLDAIAARYRSGEQAAIVGIPLGDGRLYTNSVLGFMPGIAQPYRYDKHHLVPFGEFIPGLFRWFTDLMNIPLGDFRRGGLAQPGFDFGGQRIAPNICYEDLFGDEIGANFRSLEAAPTMLLNVSNIAWFGDSLAIDQHLAISRMRALEFERPMVRSTNTGATVVIDHAGRVTHALPRLTRGVLQAEVEGRRGLTPFARWVSVAGLWPFWIGAGAIGLAFALARRNGTLRKS